MNKKEIFTNKNMLMQINVFKTEHYSEQKNRNYSESDSTSDFDSNSVSDSNSDSDSDFNSVFMNLDIFIFFILCLHSCK